jgi:hypothetical protein
MDHDEYGAECGDPYRECQISALGRIQNKAAKFAHQTRGPVWEPMAQRRWTARMFALYKAYNGEKAWKDIGGRLQASYYCSRVDHCWKIRSRKIRTDVGKFSFVNRTIPDCNWLPERETGTSFVKTHIFKKRVRKEEIEVKGGYILYYCYAFCILYYLRITVYVLFIVYVTLPPGISPNAVGNII